MCVTDKPIKKKGKNKQAKKKIRNLNINMVISVMGQQRLKMLSTLFTLCLCILCGAHGDEQTNNVFDPLASIFIRQEATLRKLDALILRLGRLDALEAKLEDMKNLLENEQEKSKVQASHLEAMESKLDEVSIDVKQLNLSVGSIGFSICQLEDRLEGVSKDTSDDWKGVNSFMQNLTEVTNQMMVNHASNLSIIAEAGMDEIKSYAEGIILNMTVPSQSKGTNDSLQLDTEIKENLLKLSDLMESNTNITKHLFAATFNRIAVSNLAMDKRFGALLHTSSARQRVLQDSLLTAMTSLSAVVKTQSQDVIRKTESKFGTLELSLASSVKLHAKELATQVLEAANMTLSEVSSNTMSRLEDLNQALVNHSLLIEDTLFLLQELKNQTTQLPQVERGNELCVVTVGEEQENATLVYTERPLTELENIIREQQKSYNQQLSEIDDQLAGLRIYYSTSLHMHTDQVVSAVKSNHDDVTEAVTDALAKSTRHLEKLRRSSLGYLDAAVTSISSAAVASAQSTADQLKNALKSIETNMGVKFEKLQSSVHHLGIFCPPMYQNIGGICLLSFQEALTSWDTARHLCQQEGGDLIIIENNDIYGHLKTLLYANHARDTIPPPPYWVGARKHNGEWVWPNGSPVAVQIGEARIENGNIAFDFGGFEDECLMTWGEGIELIPGSCESLRAVLCQYSSNQSNHIVPAQDNLVYISNPHSTQRPNEIVDDDDHNYNLSYGYEEDWYTG